MMKQRIQYQQEELNNEEMDQYNNIYPAEDSLISRSDENKNLY